MAKLTTLKKSSGELQNAETAKNCRIPNVEVPYGVMQAVQSFIKDHDSTMSQFWLEAATYRLQLKEIQDGKDELNNILEQIKDAESKLMEIEARQKRLEELEQYQNSLLEERSQELDRKAQELEDLYQVKLAELKEEHDSQERDYQERLAAIDQEIRERNEEYRRFLEMDYQEKEREMIRREAQLEVRDEIVAEKEKFWSTMYDAVIKLTRVCGALKQQ